MPATDTTIADFVRCIYEANDIVELRYLWPARDEHRRPGQVWLAAKNLNYPRAVATATKLNNEGWGVFVVLYINEILIRPTIQDL